MGIFHIYRKYKGEIDTIEIVLSNNSRAKVRKNSTIKRIHLRSGDDHNPDIPHKQFFILLVTALPEFDRNKAELLYQELTQKHLKNIADKNYEHYPEIVNTRIKREGYFFEISSIEGSEVFIYKTNDIPEKSYKSYEEASVFCKKNYMC